MRGIGIYLLGNNEIGTRQTSRFALADNIEFGSDEKKVREYIKGGNELSDGIPDDEPKEFTLVQEDNGDSDS